MFDDQNADDYPFGADLEEEEHEFVPPIFAPGTFFNLDKPMEVEAYKLND